MADGLYLIAQEYHAKTDEYDRRTFTGVQIFGEIPPADFHERSMSERYAQNLRQQLRIEAVAKGYTGKEFQHAIFYHRSQR